MPETEIGTERLREILVSDWGKLQAASNLDVSSLAQADDANSLTVGNDLFQLTARRDAYHSLMPVVAQASQASRVNASYALQCVNGMDVSGTSVDVKTMSILMRYWSSDDHWFTQNVTDPIFTAPDFNLMDSQDVYRAGEQPNDFCVELWPTVATGPCLP